MEFRCRLATAGGEITEGVYVAESEARLRRELEEKGLYVLSLQRRGGLPGIAGLTAGRRHHVRPQEFLMFNQELATLLKAGMPLVQSLDILRQRVKNATFKAVLDGVHEKVRSGTALSDAFAEHGDLFPPIYAASLTAGERSGNLDSVIRRYVSYEKIISAVRRRTLSALIYPVVLLVLMTVLVGIIVLKVVPAFSEFYASFDRDLPLSTRMIMGFSDLLVENIVLVLMVVLGTILVVRAWMIRKREQFHRLILELPWIGPTVRKFATSQLARTLATLLSGGIPLVNALEIAARAMSNRFMARELDDVGRRVREGEGFAKALLARQIFPDVAVKMVEVGEQTGALQEMLNSLAEFYDEEIETEVGRYITLIEPLMLVLMGLVIAVVVLALYMPLFELSSVMK